MPPALHAGWRSVRGEAPGRCLCQVAGAAVLRTSRISALCCRTWATSVSGSGAGAHSRRCPPRTRILPPARRTASITGAAVMAPMPPPNRQHGVRWSVSNAAWSVSDQATAPIRVDFQGTGQCGQVGQFVRQETPGLRDLARGRTQGSCAGDQTAHISTSQPTASRNSRSADPPVSFFCPN